MGDGLSVCTLPWCVLFGREVQSRKRNQQVFLEIASIAIKTLLLTWKQETFGLEEVYSEWKGSEVLSFFPLLLPVAAYTTGVVPFSSPPPSPRDLDPSSASEPHDPEHDFDFIEPHTLVPC